MKRKLFFLKNSWLPRKRKLTFIQKTLVVNGTLALAQSKVALFYENWFPNTKTNFAWDL